MGNAAVERYLKLHGGIDVDQKDSDRRNNRGGCDCYHRLRNGRISAKCVRRRHNWLGQRYGRGPEGGTLPGSQEERRRRDALASRNRGSAAERQGLEAREERCVPRGDEQRSVPEGHVERRVS